jgi:hypothetical protein
VVRDTYDRDRESSEETQGNLPGDSGTGSQESVQVTVGDVTVSVERGEHSEHIEIDISTGSQGAGAATEDASPGGGLAGDSGTVSQE